jgi:hypothetical protein
MFGRTEGNNDETQVRLAGVLAKIQTGHSLNILHEPRYLVLQLNEHSEPRHKLRIPCIHKAVFLLKLKNQH